MFNRLNLILGCMFSVVLVTSAQTNNTIALMSSKDPAFISPEMLMQVNTNTPVAVLKQLRNQSITDKLGGTNELKEQLSQLEPTGRYVERYIRIPASQNSEGRLVRCLIPVFRAKE